LSNGSMSSDTSGEGDIRKNLIEADLVDCMVSLPAQLFYNTTIPACLWFLSRNKTNGKFRSRSGEILFIDARNLGKMISRKQKDLTNLDIAKITHAYHNWRSKDVIGAYADEAGFCKAVNLNDVRKNNYILTPGRYIDLKEDKDDSGTFDQKMLELTVELSEQMAKAATIDEQIKANLAKVGYELN
jgi:type I restriction enzyme M protein